LFSKTGILSPLFLKVKIVANFQSNSNGRHMNMQQWCQAVVFFNLLKIKDFKKGTTSNAQMRAFEVLAFGHFGRGGGV